MINLIHSLILELKVQYFQGWIFFRSEYFSEVNIFKGEYFLEVNNFQGWIFSIFIQTLINSNLINTFGPSGALGQQVLSHPNKQACNIVFYSYFIRRLKNYLHKQYIPVNQGNGWACEQISKCFSRHDLWRLFGPIYVPILIKSYFSTRPYVILYVHIFLYFWKYENMGPYFPYFEETNMGYIPLWKRRNVAPWGVCS